MRENPDGVFTLCSTSSKDTSDRDWNKGSIWCSGQRELRSKAPRSSAATRNETTSFTQLSKIHFRLHQYLLCTCAGADLFREAYIRCFALIQRSVRHCLDGSHEAADDTRQGQHNKWRVRQHE